MPITGKTYKGARGGLHYYEFADSAGRVRNEKWKHQPATDPVLWMDERESALNGELALEEIQEAIDRAEDGQNPDKVPPDHQTQADFDRRLLAALMQVDNISTLLAAMPFWTAFQAAARSGNNNNARAAYLGVTFQEYQEVNGRMGAMQGIEGGANNVKARTWDGLPSEAWK